MSENLDSTIDPLESTDLDVKRKELRDIILLYANDPDSYEMLTDIALGFKREHPDCYDYILYHDLIGSTPPSWVEKFDMPNKEIENLIIDLPKYYIERKKLAA
jgi:hypothetical protein